MAGLGSKLTCLYAASAATAPTVTSDASATTMNTAATDVDVSLLCPEVFIVRVRAAQHAYLTQIK